MNICALTKAQTQANTNDSLSASTRTHAHVHTYIKHAVETTAREREDTTMRIQFRRVVEFYLYISKF